VVELGWQVFVEFFCWRRKGGGAPLFRATLGRVNGYAFASHYFVAFDSRAANQLDGPP